MSARDVHETKAFEIAIQRAKALNDLMFSGVTDPQTRLTIEVLQQGINTIRQLLAEDVGPRLGIIAGFDALDGDGCGTGDPLSQACSPRDFSRTQAGPMLAARIFCRRV